MKNRAQQRAKEGPFIIHFFSEDEIHVSIIGSIKILW